VAQEFAAAHRHDPLETINERIADDLEQLIAQASGQTIISD
jgi:hypothetical protein